MSEWRPGYVARQVPGAPFAVEAQLNVDGSPDDLAAATMLWFERLAGEFAADVLAELADRPARHVRRPTADGEAFGRVTVIRYPEGRPPQETDRTPSRSGLQWLRSDIVDSPRWVYFIAKRSGLGVTATATWPDKSPGWLRLSTSVDSLRFSQAGVQQRWLRAVLAVAERTDPGYGHLGHYYQGATALEESLDNRQHPRLAWDPDFTVGACRQILRGYAWVTIVPKEMASALDDPQSLAKSGAFVDVRPLPSGALWLRGTEDFRDYDEAAARRVFLAVAPVLRRGMPIRKPIYGSQSPCVIAFEDAADYQGGDT